MSTWKLILCFFALAVPALGQLPKARFVRIALQGEGQTLSLAEVEVVSSGQNIAAGGQASQSSTAHGGTADRAIDGNKSPKFNLNGITHTRDRQRNPWWELDLVKERRVEAVRIWNRGDGHGERLNGFHLILLDEKRTEVFSRRGLSAPEHSLQIDFKKGAELSYVAKDGSRRILNFVPEDYQDELPFLFRKSDTVAILGNGLADRMQHYGWTEANLQAGAIGKRVSFRNLAVSGDQIDSFPRSSGFKPMVEYVRQVEADVIFAMFGYNESFQMSPEDYQRGLEDFVKEARSWGKGGALPRVVLFSPIPRETVSNPHLPSAEEGNKILKDFRDVTEVAARIAGVQFVDLYDPMLVELEKAGDLTLNGVHLTEEGYQLLGQIIARALQGGAMVKPSELLKKAVSEKQAVWRARYRALDGNDIWGSRSNIKYTDNQTNAEVLTRELEQLDVMVANRDEVIWAAARGENLKVDDSNVPAALPVRTNRKNSLEPASAKAAERRYLSAQESIAKITLQSGLEIHRFADEERFPDLINPVQLQVDGKGRLWAAVWPSYPMVRPGQTVEDAILIFHDDDGDGVADRRTRFATVHCPLGFEFWNGGVVVASQPDLLFLEDTDGDDVADKTSILLQGMGSADTHHSANSLILGPDGGIYWLSGIFLQHNYESPHGPALQTGNPGLYRFDPRTFQIFFLARMGSNPHGLAFDQWGYQYATDGTSGRAFQIRPGENRFEMHPLLTKEVRPVPACEILSSTHFPDKMQQDFLICNAITYRGVKRYHLDRGKGEVWGEPAPDFLKSSDRNFRPSDVIIGADGALYLADWHNALIGHMQHNVRDPQRDARHGRIYRVTSSGGKLERRANLTDAPLEKVFAALRHPTNQVRHRARVELSARNSREVVSYARKWAGEKGVGDLERLEAFWACQQHQDRYEELAAELASSENGHVRNAIRRARLLWRLLDGGADLRQLALEGLPEVKTYRKGGILSQEGEVTKVRINCIPNKMKFDLERFTVKAGSNLVLKFHNPDHMPHNLVFVNSGKVDEVASMAVAMGAEGFEKNFVPRSEAVIRGTKLIDHGETYTLKMRVPDKKGDYGYVCTFPGHSNLMRGVMVVR